MKKLAIVCTVIISPFCFALDPVIILLGPPGSGKGTFSDFAKKQGYNQISAGDLVRDEIKNESPLGLEIKTIVQRGEYIDKGLMFQLIKNAVTSQLAKNPKLIIDGYVRSVQELESLNSLLLELNYRNKTLAIEFIAPKNVCADRILKRLVCPSCHGVFNENFKSDLNCSNCKDGILEKRINDTPEVILKRLDLYQSQLSEVKEPLKALYPLIEINADGSKEDLEASYLRLLSHIEELNTLPPSIDY